MDMSQYKTLPVWRSRIVNSLGGIDYNVEMTEINLDTAIERAILLYSKYRPEKCWVKLGKVLGKRVFDYSEMKEQVNIVDVKFLSDESDFTGRARSPYFRSCVYPSSPFTCGRDYYQQRVSNDRQNFLNGTDPTWSWDRETKKLLIETYSSSYYASALFLKPVNIDKISFDLENDFLETAIAYSKMILARKLGKYNGIPTAQGTLQTDANELRTESKETIERIKRILNSSLRKLPPKPVFR